METSSYYLNNLNEIKKSCEKLISETQDDIKIFKNEQQHFHKQIQDFQVENDLLNSKIEELRNATSHISPRTFGTGGESRDDATREHYASVSFLGTKNINELLKSENADLRQLNNTYKQNIDQLQNEIQNYRNQLFKPVSVIEIKQKYGTAIQLLESTIKRKNSELEEQSQKLETLIETKNQLDERIEKGEKLLKEQAEKLEAYAGTIETISKLESQIAELERNNKELQKTVKMSKQAVEKRYKREQEALQKVQEALSIAEASEADKQEALKRERIVKEECDNIVSTIGHVMDEAARKVGMDMEAIKNKCIEKEKILNEQKSKLDQEIENQRKFIEILNKRCQRFQQKYEEVAKDNDNLADQLEQAAKALWSLEEKVKKLEQENNKESLQKNSMDQDNKIQEFVKNNRLLRERCNTYVTELTDKFKNEISKLKEEITTLKAENEAIKLQKNI